MTDCHAVIVSLCIITLWVLFSVAYGEAVVMGLSLPMLYKEG